jgi:hypothetical protein
MYVIAMRPRQRHMAQRGDSSGQSRLSLQASSGYRSKSNAPAGADLICCGAGR